MLHPRAPGIIEALIPVGWAAAVLSVGVWLGVSVPILLAIATVAPALLAWRLGWRWGEIEEGLLDGMRLALQASTILLIVGATIGAWAQGGVIGSMILYGMDVLSPAWFLPATVLLTAVISLAIGSSWTTAATVGVALMGIGSVLGFDPPVVAGAVISGAYFGDKMSPLSDTTNLAPSLAGTDLFSHISAMLYTTVPALVVAVVGMAIVGLFAVKDTSGYDPTVLGELEQALRTGQSLSPWLLLTPVALIGLAVLRVPAIPALVAATTIGGVLAWLVQGHAPVEVLQALYSGHVSETGNIRVDELLTRGGMSSMFDTIALILTATGFGGVMEKGGFIQVLLEAMLKGIRGARGLITLTIASTVIINVLLAEQYLSIVLAGRMYKDAYPRYGLSPRMLSRSLEDGGTVTSALVPWNSCGAFMAGTLGVATLDYLPWSFLNLAVPIIAVFYAWTGLFIFRETSDEAVEP